MLVDAFNEIFSIGNLLMMNIGVAAGIIIGALPGLNVVFAIAILLPLTFGMESIAGMYLMLGSYCGAVYGGSITAIMFNTPGTPAACATLFDGYTLHQKGRTADALRVALIGSTFGGIMSALALLFFAPTLARASLHFQAPEYFVLCVFGLSTVIGIAGKQVIKGLIMATLGLIVSTIGIDAVEGTQRLMFGNIHLMAGLKPVPVLLGIFAMSEVLFKAESLFKGEGSSQPDAIVKLKKATIRIIDILKHWKDLIFSSIYGIIIGAIPGTGGVIAAMFSYNDAKRRSKHPEKFGTGCIEGIIAPETANNATTGATLIPLLTFGIPGDASAAVLLGALTMQGISPGLSLFSSGSHWVYSIMGGLLLINIFMLIQGYFFTSVFAHFSRVPKIILLPCIMILCVVGSYSISGSSFDVLVMIFAGLFGYIIKKLELPVSPLIIGMVLGNLMEVNLRRALVMSNGSISIFFTRPISAVFLILSVICLIYPVITKYVSRLKKAN